MASCFEPFRIFATKNSFKRLIYSSVFAIYYYGTDTVLTTKILNANPFSRQIYNNRLFGWQEIADQQKIP